MSGIRHVRNAKHYQVKLRFLQQHLAGRTVEFIYCPAEYQLSEGTEYPTEKKIKADYDAIVAKNMTRLSFRLARQKLRRPPPQAAAGGCVSAEKF